MLAKTLFSVALPFFVATGLVACTTTTGDVDEPAEESTDELTAAGRSLIGAYERGSGDLRGLVLTTEVASQSKNRFFAVVRTGIVCLMEPCPTEVRVEGRFRATKTTLHLTPDSSSDFPTDVAADKLRGAYLYQLINVSTGGAKLHLQPKPQPGGAISAINIPGSLEKVSSYCHDDVSAAKDCTVQGLPQPMCAQPPPGWIPAAKWTCSAQNRCSFSCSQRGTPICPDVCAAVCAGKPEPTLPAGCPSPMCSCN